MNNYSNCSKNDQKIIYRGFIINIVFFLCLMLLILGFLMMELESNIVVEWILLSDLFLIMLIICVVGVKTYIEKPNHYNQL